MVFPLNSDVGGPVIGGGTPTSGANFKMKREEKMPDPSIRNAGPGAITARSAVTSRTKRKRLTAFGSARPHKPEMGPGSPQVVRPARALRRVFFPPVAPGVPRTRNSPTTPPRSARARPPDPDAARRHSRSPRSPPPPPLPAGEPAVTPRGPQSPGKIQPFWSPTQKSLPAARRPAPPNAAIVSGASPALIPTLNTSLRPSLGDGGGPAIWPAPGPDICASQPGPRRQCSAPRIPWPISATTRTLPGANATKSTQNYARTAPIPAPSCAEGPPARYTPPPTCGPPEHCHQWRFCAMRRLSCAQGLLPRPLRPPGRGKTGPTGPRLRQFR